MNKGGFVYIMTNENKTALYVGVTSHLSGRVYDHKNRVYKNSFTDKYNIDALVYYEQFDRIEHAIEREKQIKKYRREKKDKLVDAFNPEWKDLYENILFW